MKRIKWLSLGVLLILIFSLLSQLVSMATVFSIANEISIKADNGMHAWVGIKLAGSLTLMGEQIAQIGLSPLKWLALPSLLPTTLINVILIRLFMLYFRSYIFEKQNINCINFVGWAVVLKVLIDVAYPPILIVILTMLNPDATLTKSISIDDTNISEFLIGFIIIVMAHVMAIGKSLKDESELTI